jgi:hypothetical protein
MPQPRQRNLRTPAQPDCDAVAEYVVVRLLDRVEDLLVEGERHLQAVARGRMYESQPRFGAAVQGARLLDLPRQQIADRLVDLAARQPLTIYAEQIHRFLRQVDASAAQVFADVADEVGELECGAEIDRAQLKVLPGHILAGTPENGQHLQADHRSRAPDVVR